MTGKAPFGSDPGDWAGLLEKLGFAQGFKKAGLEGTALAEAQRRNLAALEAVSRAVSAKYQADFRLALAGFRAALGAPGARRGDEEAVAVAAAASRIEALAAEAREAGDAAVEAVAAEVEAVLAAMRKTE